MKTVSIAHPVNHAAYNQLRLHPLAFYLAHVFATPFGRDHIHEKSVALAGNCHRPSASFKTSPYAQGNGLGKWRWEGITYLTICLRFSPGELPIVGETLKASDHTHSKSGHAYKFSRRRIICNPLSVHP